MMDTILSFPIVVTYLISVIFTIPTTFIARPVFDYYSGLSIEQITVITALLTVFVGGVPSLRLGYFTCIKRDKSAIRWVDRGAERIYPCVIGAIAGGIAGKAYFLAILNTEKFFMLQNAAVVMAMVLILIHKTVGHFFSPLTKLRRRISDSELLWGVRLYRISDSKLLWKARHLINGILEDLFMFISSFLAGTLCSFLGTGWWGMVSPIMLSFCVFDDFGNGGRNRRHVFGNCIIFLSSAAGLAYTAFTSNFPVIDPVIVIALIAFRYIFSRVTMTDLIMKANKWLDSNFYPKIPIRLYRRVSIAVLLFVTYPYAKALWKALDLLLSGN